MADRLTVSLCASTSAAVDPPPEMPLAVAIAKAVRDYELDRIDELGGPSRCIALEVLNAMAINAGVVLADCDGDPQARAAFDLALEESLTKRVTQ